MDQLRKVLLAAEHGNASLVSNFLDQGVHVDSTDEEGVNALHTAAANGHETVVRLLLSKGACLDSRNCYGWTALMLAALYGHILVVGILLQHKADIFVSNDLGATALDCAARCGHVQVVRLLVEASEQNLASSQKSYLTDTCLSALMSAAQHGQETVVELLLEKGTGVSYKEGVTGWSPLMVAALNGHMRIVQVLCENGADVNSVNVLEQTALEIAAIRQRNDVETYLEKKTTTRPQRGGHKPFRQSIIEAARNGDLLNVRDLLEKNDIDANATGDDGATPLMFACMRGHQNVAQLLLDKGANINTQDKISGWTALMQATYYGHRQLVKLLIDSGANVNIQARDGSTAFDMASIIGDTEILRLLASVSMQLSPNRKTNGASPWSSNKIKSSSKENENMQIPIRELVKFDGTDLSKTGLKVWLSKMSNRLRNMTLVRTLRPPSSTRLRDISSDYGSSKMSDSDSSGSAPSMTTVSWDHASTKDGKKTSLSSSTGSGDGNMARSLATVVDSALKAGGHDVKRPKTLALGSPMTRLPDDVISPVVPPSMPAPAFELTRIQREHGSDDDESTTPQSSVSGYSAYRRRHGNKPVLSDRPNFSGSPESSYSTASFLSSVSNNSGSRTLKATSPSPVEVTPFLPTSMASLRQRQPRPCPSPSPTLISVATSSSAPGRLQPIPGAQKPMRSSMPFGHVNGNGVEDSSAIRSRMAAMDNSNEEELANILKKLSLEKYTSMFEEQEVDMEAFLTLNDEHLEELGVTHRDARSQILSAIAELNSGKDRERQHFHEVTSGYGSGSPSTSMSISRWAYPPSNLKHSR